MGDAAMQVDRPARDPRVRRAIAISAKYRKRFPYQQYGPAYFKRGSPESLNMFGPSYKQATAAQKVNRRESGFVGRGKYNFLKSAVKYAGRYGPAAALAGAQLYKGNVAGAVSGWQKGRAMSRMMGFGDYVDNQIIEGSTNRPMSVNSGGDLSGDITFSHSEFVANVTVSGTGGTTTSFQNQGYDINPGLGELFPWLSQIAQNFTLYEFQGLIVEYRPTSGEYGSSSSNALGKVIIATNYNVKEPDFPNAIAMANYDYAISCKPSEHMRHGIETKPGSQALDVLYVRTGETTTMDQMFTDIGRLQVATEGIAIGGTGAQVAVIGELWIHYKIRLSRANLFGSILGANIQSDSFFGLSDANTLTGGTATGINTYAMASKYKLDPTGNLWLAQKLTNSMGGQVFASNNALTYFWPTTVRNGTYVVMWTMQATLGNFIGTFTTPTLNACTLLGTGKNINQDGSGWFSINASTENRAGVIFIVKVAAATGQTASIVMPVTAGLNGMISMVTVSQLNTACFE